MPYFTVKRFIIKLRYKKIKCLRYTFQQHAIASSSAIAESPRCRVGQFWPKVEDDILQTI